MTTVRNSLAGRRLQLRRRAISDAADLGADEAGILTVLFALEHVRDLARIQAFAATGDEAVAAWRQRLAAVQQVIDALVEDHEAGGSTAIRRHVRAVYAAERSDQW